MTPRRIAYVLRSFPRLSETFVAGELAGVLRRGVDVKILSLEPPVDEPHHEIVRRTGLIERTVYEPALFRAALRDFAPDLIHAHFARSATACARELSAELGVPYTFTAHRYDIYAKPPPDFAERAADAAAVVTVSDANAVYIEHTFGVPASRITVISCGVDTRQFSPDGPRPAPPEIVCVARLKPFKNQRILLDACALLRDRGLAFRCVLVGDGPCRDELEAQRRRLGLEDLVELVGAAEQSNVLRWWRRATVAVLPSDSEGMPVCLMEAAACGVPAVATAVGGNPELVVDGVTGALVPPGDAGALADEIERLLRDPELGRRMGEAARRRAEERFSIEHQVDRLLELWEGVMTGNGEAVRIPVEDPLGAARDTELPTLALALDPATAASALEHRLPRLAGEDGIVRLRAIRATTYKPRRRCVVEYDVAVERPGAAIEHVTLVGKVRVRRFGKSGYRVLDAVWNAGFQSDSVDGISVPEPIGTVGTLQMWLQRKVPGRIATTELGGEGGESLGRRVAEAAFKLHESGVANERRHTLADELRILSERLPEVTLHNSTWQHRVDRVLEASGRLASTISEPAFRTIHRDFYSDQVIVDGDRLYLLDFDELCEGDPALDVGNFVGALTEQSVRTLGAPDALAHMERALEERYAELAGEEAAERVPKYATLTLVRQIAISTRFADRRRFTKTLLELSEERLGLATGAKALTRARVSGTAEAGKPSAHGHSG